MAEATLYSETTDGYVSSTGATWSVTMAGTGTLGGATDSQKATWGTRWPPGCYMHFHEFDLSGIPSGSTVTAATFSLYAGDNNMNTRHVVAEVYEYEFGTLTTADWRTGGDGGDLDTMHDAGGLLASTGGDGKSSNSYWVFTSQAAFLSAVEDHLGGTLQVVVAPDYLRIGTEPSDEWYWTEFNFADSASNRPRLVVEYTEPVGFVGLTVIRDVHA